MTKSEISKCAANVHNILSNIMVSGDGAIMMASALMDLRKLVDVLQRDIEKEECTVNGGGDEK